MAKVGYIFKSEYYDGYDEDIKWMEDYGCSRVVTELSEHVNLKNKKNMWQQIEFSLKEHRRGFHLVTGEIIGKLPTLPKVGLLHLFIKHTSCALSINENADPDFALTWRASSIT